VSFQQFIPHLKERLSDGKKSIPASKNQLKHEIHS